MLPLILFSLIHFALPPQAIAGTVLLREVTFTNEAGTPLDAAARAIRADPLGNFFAGIQPNGGCSAVGTCSSCSGDMWITKFDRALSVIKSTTPGGGGNVYDIAVDSNSNVFVGVNCGFWKFNSDLVFQSSITFGAALDTTARGLSVSPISGDVYIVGDGEVGIQRYSSSLTFISSRTSPGIPLKVKVAPGGDVFVVGNGPVGMTQYSASLSLIGIAGTGTGNDLEFDSKGNIYVAGGTTGIIKFSGLTPIQSGTTSDLTEPRIAIDGSDHPIIFGGIFPGTGCGIQRFTPSLAAGARETSTNCNYGYGIAYDRFTGRVYVSGGTTSAYLGIFGVSQVTGLSEAFAFPSPFSPAVSSEMTFANVPPAARIRILTIAGQFVRELEASQDGVGHWNGRDSNGNTVAPGTYYVLATFGTESKRFKVMVLP